MRPRLALPLLLPLLLGACASPAPRVADQPFALDSFRWRAESTPQTAVVARNEWGDLRVRTAARGGLVVAAMIQRIGTTRDELEVRIDEGAETVRVAVVPRVRRPRGRVDLTLIVPPGKRVEGTTRDGIAEIKYRGDVRVRTRSGDITIETPGQASVRSDAGDITAKLSGEAWRRPQSFSSGSGAVTLWLPEQAAVEAAPGLHLASARGAVRILRYAAPPPPVAQLAPTPN